MIIDGHVHFIESFRSVSMHGESRPTGNGCVEFADGSTARIVPEGLGEYGFAPETFIDTYMAPNAIDKAILMQAGYYGFQDLYYAEVCKQYPGKFFPACAIDPYAGNWKVILDRFLNELNFRILKFEVSEFAGLVGYHPEMKLDGPEMRRIFDVVADKGVTVVFDIGGRDQKSYQIPELDRLASDYPGIHFVFEHFLGMDRPMDEQWQQDILLLGRHENVWLGMASLPWFMNETAYPFPNSLELVEFVCSKLGSKKIIWGSDAPMIMTKIDYTQQLNYLKASDVLTDEDLENIYANAAIAAYRL